MSELSGESRYAKILHLPHHKSKTRPHMSMAERAAQFAPFSPLDTYDERILESERLTKSRVELTEEEIAALGEKTTLLQTLLAEHPQVTLDLFVPDSRKNGGSYLRLTGDLLRIDEVSGYFTLSCDQAQTAAYDAARRGAAMTGENRTSGKLSEPDTLDKEAVRLRRTVAMRDICAIDSPVFAIFRDIRYDEPG